MSDYTIEYVAERVLPVGLRGDALRGVKVYECSCLVRDSKGVEIDARFSLTYTQEAADAEGLTLAAYRDGLAKMRLAEMLVAKGLDAPAEVHPAMGKSTLAVSKADLAAKAAIG